MLQAKDIMTTKVITVAPETAVEDLAAILWENHISGVPVVDDDGNVTGVATENDLIDQTKKFHIPTVVSILDSVIFLEHPNKIDRDLKKMTGTKVAEICSGELVTIGEEASLADIATIMAEKQVHTLPVVTNGRLVGVVGKSDIIQTLCRK